MFQNGRGIDYDFRARHKLYWRCVKEHLEGDRIITARIRCDNLSVNWSKYSKPWDVIFDHPGQGIVRFKVANIPVALPRNKPPGVSVAPHDYRPAHNPLPKNYAHSEIRAYRGDASVKEVSSSLVKKEFRAAMSDCGVASLGHCCPVNKRINSIG
jgi:hypothetical protein